jgi:hypothetical protein
MHTPIRCLAIALLPQFLLGSLLEGREERQIYASRSAGLSFELPTNADVYEREFFVHADHARPEEIRIIRIVPRGVREEASLGRTLALITVYSLDGAKSLEEWLSKRLPSPRKTSSVRIAGQSAIRTRSRFRARRPEPAQYFLARSEHVYQFSAAAGAKNDVALAEIFRTLRFTDSVKDIAESAETLAERAASVAPQVRAVYLVPSDRVPHEGYRIGIEKAIRQLQIFYRNELGSGKTFSLHDPVVEVLATPHPVSWYQMDAPASWEAGRFWEAVLYDGFALTGGTFDDPNNRWVFYVDADPLCTQIVGATNGVALLPRNDLRGLVCDGNTPPCQGDDPDLGAVCRWVGGLGHELGHAFNLPHPTPGSCPPPDTACQFALLLFGYGTYPNAYLLPSDKDSLVNSPQTAEFFTVLDPGPLSYACGDGCPPSRPTGLSATGQAGRVVLNWNPSAGAASYRVWRSAGENSSFDVIASSVGTTSFDDTSVTPGSTYRYFITAQNSIGQSGNSNAATAMVPTPLVFYTVPPCRVVDTRNEAGPWGGPPLAAGAERVFTIMDRCTIPTSARSVSLNVAVTQADAPGNLSLYPAGISVPLVSAVNYVAGMTRSNNAIVPLSAAGALAVYCNQGSGTVHVILDVTGYFE